MVTYFYGLPALKKIILLGVALILMLALSPGLALSDSETITDRKITHITSYHGHAVVSYSPPFEDSQNCGGTSTTKAIIRYVEDTITRKEMYSLALAAASAGKTVNIGIFECDDVTPAIYKITVEY